MSNNRQYQPSLYSIFGYQIRESDKHAKGKIRLYDLFKKLGYEAHKEVPSREIIESGSVKNYVFDVLIYGKLAKSNNPIYVILEVDGRKGHRTGITDIKGKIRDDHFMNKYNIPTIRFAFEDLHGAKEIDDNLIIEEVEYWIKVHLKKIIYQNKPMNLRKNKCCKCVHFPQDHTFAGCLICDCEYGYIHELQ